MFRDYYAILEINQDANPQEIKAAFKRQALKWHPDKNPQEDTTEKMQVINEAKLILLDNEARFKYDIEYNRFKASKLQKSKASNERNQRKHSNTKQTFNKNWKDFEPDFEYDIEDEELYRWMKNAKMQSVDLAKKTIEDFKGMVKAGTKAAAKEAVSVFTIQIVLGLIISLFFLLSKAC